jgi:hypothetical protein
MDSTSGQTRARTRQPGAKCASRACDQCRVRKTRVNTTLLVPTIWLFRFPANAVVYSAVFLGHVQNAYILDLSVRFSSRKRREDRLPGKWYQVAHRLNEKKETKNKKKKETAATD